MKAYKGFDKDLKCRGFQYEVGKEYETDEADICKSGFHACEMPLDVLGYYAPGEESRYCEVDLDANDQTESDSKRVGKKIKVNAEIGIAGLVEAQFEFVKKNVKKSVERGDSEAATAGYCGAATAGYCGAATAGSCGAATAGEYGAATAGYCGAATSRGKSAVGENGLATARGNNVRVKGGKGAVLVLCEENGRDHEIKEWKAAVVDGDVIKADTWYKLLNGEFVEAEQ